MDLRITGKNVLVVGASKGIGRAIALAFSREGCVVTAVARSTELLTGLLADMGGEALGHHVITADVSAEGTGKALAQQWLNAGHRFDIVVHNVGHPHGVRDPLSPMIEWRRVWYLNAGIAIDMNEVLVPPMLERGWGRVIHISSISAEMLRGAAPYAAAKAYLNAYTKTVGRALAQTGVIFSAIMPGAVAFEGSYWDIQSSTQPERVSDFLRHHQAVGRFGSPEEIASYAVFLGSHLASFAQGTVLPVDGGNM